MINNLASKYLIGVLAIAAINTPALLRAAPPQADLTSAPFVIIAGKNVPWGSGATINATQARAASGGVCEFPAQHNVRNVGKAASGPFQTRFDNNAVAGGFTRQWPSIEPGQTSTQTDILRLRPGNNTLVLHIDAANQVRESNENNNQFRIAIQVNGKCVLDQGTLR